MAKQKYRNKKTGTVYTSVVFIKGTRIATVRTEAGSEYVVNSDSLEPVAALNPSTSKQGEQHG